jgi:electron transfer flavoprotein beta subunit
MKLLVCVKRVVDYNVKIRVKLDGSGSVAALKLARPGLRQDEAERG